ncbi:MAG: M28 family peptidase, partial [Bifidobacteriaceae bacterium]|nr:M28 family peptidase [Bifidobacteriaceae bacterium]
MPHLHNPIDNSTRPIRRSNRFAPRMAAVLAVATATITLGTAAPAASGSPKPLLAFPAAPAQEASTPITQAEQAILDRFDTDYVISHIRHIEDNIGPGVGGSPAERHRASYLAGQLAALGYGPWTKATASDGVADYFQEFAATQVAATIPGSVTIGGREFPANGPAYRQDGVYQGFNVPEVSGPSIYFATPDEATAAPAAEVAGKVVLTHRPAGTQGRTAYAAAAATLESHGAAAVVFFHPKYTIDANGATSAENTFSAVTTGAPINIPVVLTSYFDGQTILDTLSGPSGIGSQEVVVRNARGTTSVNVLAVKPAIQPTERTVIIGGHLDSRTGTVGANDNLSGPAVILGIAKAIRDVPTTYNVVFAFWGSEELGLVGSKAFYATTLEPNDFSSNIAAYYNLDMAATAQESNAYLTIHTPYRDTANGNAPLRSSAGDTVAVQAERYWDFANGAGQLDTWWKKEWIDPATNSVAVVGLEYFGNCSDHASIAGANASPRVEFDDAIPQVYTFWRGGGINTGSSNVTELNYH